MGHVRGCARCGGDHNELEWELLERPIVDSGVIWTHWCACPANGQPILMRNGGTQIVTELSVEFGAHD